MQRAIATEPSPTWNAQPPTLAPRWLAGPSRGKAISKQDQVSSRNDNILAHFGNTYRSSVPFKHVTRKEFFHRDAGEDCLSGHFKPGHNRLSGHMLRMVFFVAIL